MNETKNKTQPHPISSLEESHALPEIIHLFGKHFLSFVYIFETGSHSAAHSGLELGAAQKAV